MGTKEPFGGLSIIIVGDLLQLKPVFDHWIFENSKDGCTAELKELRNKYQTILQKPWACTQFVPYLKTQHMILQQTCQLLMV